MLDSSDQWHWHRPSPGVWNFQLGPAGRRHPILRRAAQLLQVPREPQLSRCLYHSPQVCYGQAYQPNWRLRLGLSHNHYQLQVNLTHLHWRGVRHRFDHQRKHYAEILQASLLFSGEMPCQWFQYHHDRLSATMGFRPLSGSIYQEPLWPSDYLRSPNYSKISAPTA